MANKCVTPSGTGSGTGNDWNNTLSWSSATPVRGDTWYLADGTYASKTLDTANSSTTVITIKKATASDHVTETGWSSGMGDGQATISELTLGSDYWTVDGVQRNESDWKDGNSYGIRVTSVTASTALTPGVAASHIVMRYINGGGAEGTTYTGSEPTHVFRIAGFDEIATDWTIERCYMHNIGSIALCHLYGLDTGLIQYNWLGNAWGKEAIIGSITFKNVVIRYNMLKDAAGDTGLPGEGATADIAIWNSDNAGDFDNNKIYGNIIWRTRDENNGGTIVVGGDNGVGWAGVPASNTEVYNNTIAGIQNALGGLILINGGTGNIARNNLWWDTGTFSGASANTESDNVIASSDPFVNYATGDFHLASAIAGFSLSSPYNVDLEGETRGGDGTFDVGALEFTSNTDTDKFFSADAVIQATNNKSYFEDAVIQATVEKQYSLDTVVQVTTDKQYSLDAVIQLTQEKSYTVDAVVQGDAAKTFSVDAVILSAGDKWFTVDALILETLDKAFSIDASIIATTDKSFGIDAAVLVPTLMYVLVENFTTKNSALVNSFSTSNIDVTARFSSVSNVKISGFSATPVVTIGGFDVND
jgi:hypothetical protein